MDRHRRPLSATAGALVLGLLATACAPPRASQVVTIRFWGLGREGEVARELVPEFERRHSGVRVEVQQIPWTAAHEKLLTAFVGRATPDVAQVGNTWVPEFEALGAIAPLDGRVSGSTTVRREGYFPGIWDTNVVDGRVWGIPWYVDTRLLFYRTDLLAEAGFRSPPRTWAEWLEAARAIKRDGHAFAQLFPTDEWAQPVIFAMQAGSPLLRDGGRRGAFRAPEFRRGFEFYLTFFREGLAPQAINAQIGNLYQQFAEGWFSLYVTGPWNLGEFRTRIPPAFQARWATAPLPHPTDARAGVGISLAGGSSLVVFARGERADASWAWIEYLSEPATQMRFHALTGDLPARTEAWSDPALAGDERARAFFTQLQHVRPTPQVPEWEQIAQKVAELGEYAIRGRMSVDETLAAIDRAVDRILEKRRFLLDRDREAPR